MALEKNLCPMKSRTDILQTYAIDPYQQLAYTNGRNWASSGQGLSAI
jgi:hypothetical protein